MNISRISPPLLTILVSAALLFSCEGVSTGNTAESPKETSATQLNQETISSSRSIPSDTSSSMDTESEGKTRGLDMSMARLSYTSLEENFPLLYKLCQSDPQLLEELERYAKKVVNEDVGSESDILNLMEQRDSMVIPYMTPLFENMASDQLDQNWGEYQKELSQLGMSMTAAEGMFTTIGGTQFLDQKIQALGSEEFKAYVKFFNSLTETRNGEYPFQNMKPFLDMILAGEVVLNGKNDMYKERINPEFQMALEAFTDVHFISNPGTRQVELALTGGTHTEPYPYLVELETAKEFVESDIPSTYKKALSQILKSPSEITDKPENIYVVVVEWAKSQNMAQMRVRSHLGKGEDVPHYLKIRRGDGTDQYAVAYRFFENEEKANAAYDEAIKQFPNARLIYCSVKNGELYQLGI